MKTSVPPGTLVGGKLRGGRERLILLRRADRPVLLHSLQYITEAFFGAIRMAVRIVVVWSLQQARQHSALGQRKILGGFAEITARRHFDAPGTAAEIGGIEIEFENFVLAQRAFEPRRHDHFANFALIGDVLAHQQVFHHLLCNGRSALRPPRVGEIADKGADDAALVDTMMLIEAAVFSGDERLLHRLGNVSERYPNAPIAGLEHVGEIPPIAVQDNAHARQSSAFEHVLIGQIGHRSVEEVDDLSHVDDWIRDWLVLAELVIGSVEISEIETAKRLDLGAHCLGIVERGSNQLVEIDRFDVEGLLHMRAAVAQDLHDFVLILSRIELRLDCLRLGRNLAQCERRRKNFNQDQVHGSGAGWPDSSDATRQRRL